MANLYKRHSKKDELLNDGKSTYYINYQAERGKDGRRRVSLGRLTPREADIKLHQFSLREHGIATQADRNLVLFRTFVEQKYIPVFYKHKPETVQRVIGVITNHLIPIFGDLYLDQITTYDIEYYMSSRLEKGRWSKNKRYSPQTINGEIKRLMAILNAAVKWRIIDRHEVNDFKYFKEKSNRPKYFTQEQLQAIYDKSNRPHWWRFMANSGVRLGEAMRIEWDDILSDRIIIKATKNAAINDFKIREIPIFSGLERALDEFDKERRLNDIYLFPRITCNYFGDYAKLDIARAGVVGHCHMFRHTFATMMLRHGADLRTVQKLLGHFKIETTEQYLHANTDRILQNVNLNI